jgi:hypothetical protein
MIVYLNITLNNIFFPPFYQSHEISNSNIFAPYFDIVLAPKIDGV